MSELLLIPCPSCGANNRIPQEKIAGGKKAICGKCKTPLDLHAAPALITDANFSTSVESAALPVLLDMWAPWCGPCRAIAPVIEQIATDMAGRVIVGKLNVDENPQTAARFQVQSIPTLLVLKGGREVDRIVGAQPKAEILRRLERVVA